MIKAITDERSLIAVLAMVNERSLIAVLTTGMSKRAFVCFFLFSSGRLPKLRTVVISSQNVDGDNQRHPLLASCHAWENFSQNAELNVTPCNGAVFGRFPETLAFRRAVRSKRPAHQWKDASLFDALQAYGPHRYRARLQSTVRVRRLRTKSCAICRGGPCRMEIMIYS